MAALLWVVVLAVVFGAAAGIADLIDDGNDRLERCLLALDEPISHVRVTGGDLNA